MSLRKRLERLEGRGQGEGGISIWDVIAGVAPMPADLDDLDPRHRQGALEALRILERPFDMPCRVEERLREAID